MIPILLGNEKTVMSFCQEDQVFYLIYITIDNLDAKMHLSQNWPYTLFLSSIPVVYEQAEDINDENRDLKIIIYYLILVTMLKCI